MRVYCLSSEGNMERNARTDGEWTGGWWQTSGSKVPYTPHGALAAIAYNAEEVRVYYVSGGKLYEVGLTMSLGRCWGGDYIN